jgi:phage shock protein PspC (stress-responsive transcriptional regulator)
MEIKTIHKAKKGRIIDGVCRGSAVYLGVDPLWVRLAWAALGLAGGIGILAYALAMYLFPRAEEEAEDERVLERTSGPLIAGIALIVVGALIVLRAINVVHYGFWAAWDIAWTILWPLTIIGGGVFLLLVHLRQRSGDGPQFVRPAEDRMVLGVSAGVARHLRVDPNVVRFWMALLIVLSRGIGLGVYLLVGFLTPDAPSESPEE